MKRKIRYYISEGDSRWLASAIDGEGSIAADSRGYPRIQVFNTNPEFIKKASKLMRASITVAEREGKKPLYITGTYGRACFPLLRRLLPYLIVKRENAQEILKNNPGLEKIGSKEPRVGRTFVGFTALEEEVIRTLIEKKDEPRPISEVARELRISPNAVRTALYRVRMRYYKAEDFIKIYHDFKRKLGTRRKYL